MSNLLRFVIMGPPGSGKGTISSRIVKTFNLNYVASGDILRSHIQSGTTIGKSVKSYIEKGQLVPDEIITTMILEELKDIHKYDWLLDGFPRTVPQAMTLTSLYNINMAISLNVPDDIIISRLKGRWLHPASGRVYHTEFNPPKILGKDDITGEELIQREDDKPEIVLSRLQNYKKTYNPILKYFKEKNTFMEFSGKDSNQIWPRVQDFLSDIFKKSS